MGETSWKIVVVIFRSLIASLIWKELISGWVPYVKYFDCGELCDVTVEEVIVYSRWLQYLIYRVYLLTFVDTYVMRRLIPI